MSNPVNKLFVYGTLGPGRPNEHWLKRIGGTFEKASIRGKLFEEGWGATMGYPALVIDREAQEIQGHVFTSENLADHWMELDEFEGEGYERILTRVKLENEQVTDAYVYALNPAPDK